MNQKERSLRDGDKIEVGNQIYFGRPPQFAFINGQWLKVRKGIPFVKP
jgi:hypothetical protein